MTNTQVNTRRPNLKSIALPAEHGSWSLILEPLILGLILAPTWMGLSFALAMMAVFLVHQPAKVLLKAIRTGKSSERSRYAGYFLVGYLLAGVLFAIPALLQSTANFWLVISLIIPFALIQIVYDFRNESRNQIAEITGSIALSGGVALLVIIGDWQIGLALLLWLVMALRAVTSILYVRTFFRKQRNQEANIKGNYLIHGIALSAVFLFAMQGMLPYLSIAPFIILFARAVHGLQSDEAVKAQIIGIREVIFGILTVGFIAVGFIFTI